jgi:hypothetical protein
MSQIQLVSRGDLDVFLTGNPSITFFKSVYRKHTNFSMEDMLISTITTPQTGSKYSVKIPTGTGDLLYGTNLILKGNKVFCGNGIANISTAVLDNITFSIGNREIDKTFGHYLEVYHELNQENPNNTITNLGRIEDSSLYHLAHTADLAALATHKSMLNNNRSDITYIDNSLAKPTNIMGHGLGHPPTHFQKSSKCGGTYCAPSYLQNQDGIDPNTTESTENEYINNFNFVSSINTRPKSSAMVSGLNRQRVTLKITAYDLTVNIGTIKYSLNTNVDDTTNRYIRFTNGDKLKLISGGGANFGNFKTGFDGASDGNGNLTVDYEVDGTITFKSNLGAGSNQSSPVIYATFILEQKNFSGRLMDNEHIKDSVLKGDILGDCNVPLNFWYCRSPGLAVPLISLSKGTDVELYVQMASSDIADWTSSSRVDGTGATQQITDNNNQFISYDQNINNVNDITNGYKIGDNDLKPIYNGTSNFNFNLQVSVGYIFLDNMERQRFQNSSHEYLIEQLQFRQENSDSVSDINISSLQHPVKELIWTGQPYINSNIKSIDQTDINSNYITDTASTGKLEKLNNGTFAHPSGVRFVSGKSGEDIDDVLYGGGIQNSAFSKGFGNTQFKHTINTLPAAPETTPHQGTYISQIYKKLASGVGTTVPWDGNGKFVQGLLGPSTPDVLNYCSYKLELNGIDRCQYRPLQHYTRENIRKYHKGGCISVPDSIAVFSFALDPNSTEPTGTCNFTNIDSIVLKRHMTPSSNMKMKKLNIYAINYNILRFVNGQAGLAYVL